MPINKVKVSIKIFMLVCIVSLGAFLRASNIRFCSYDQYIDRDCYLTDQLLKGQNIPPLGPELIKSGFDAHIAGSFTYYLMSIPFFFDRHPISVAYFTVILNIASIILLFFFAKRFFGESTAFLSALLFAVSPRMVEIARQPWHPSMMIPFLFIFYYLLFELVISNNSFVLAPLLCLWGIIFQLHFTGIFLLAVLLVALLLFKPQIKPANLLIGLAIVLLFYAPYFVYEVKQGFLNEKIIYGKLVSTDTHFSFLPFANFILHKEKYFFDLGSLNRLLGQIDLSDLKYAIDYTRNLALLPFAKFSGAAALFIFFAGLFFCIKFKSKKEVLLILCFALPLAAMAFFRLEKSVDFAGRHILLRYLPDRFLISKIAERYLNLVFILSPLFLSLGILNIKKLICRLSGNAAFLLKSLLIIIITIIVLVQSVYAFRVFDWEPSMNDERLIGSIKSNSDLAEILACELHIDRDYLINRVITEDDSEDYDFFYPGMGYVFLYYQRKCPRIVQEPRDDFIVVMPPAYKISRLLQLAKPDIEIKKILGSQYFKVIVYFQRNGGAQLQSRLGRRIFNYYVFGK